MYVRVCLILVVSCMKYMANAVSPLSPLTISLIHYSFVPLILFLGLNTLDLLLRHLSFANGAGGVEVINFIIRK